MRLRSQLPEHYRWITLLALGLVFGHDFLMAANTHQPPDTHADHAIVEQCGSTEGVLALTVILPAAHPAAAFPGVNTSAPDLLAVFQTEDQIATLADASVRRAMLQVFLN